MTHQDITRQIVSKKSYLCVGLDTDINKIPRFLLEKEYPVFEFNRAIIDATVPFTVAYKLNTAFYESLGAAGWICMEMTVDYLKKNYPDVFVIADAKRGDVGNTSRMYALAFLKNMLFDAITVAPYMGEDSVSPFLSVEGKWIILLAVTSNKGAEDFQMSVQQEGSEKLWERVVRTSLKWGSVNNMMFVVGGTRPEVFGRMRKLAPEHFLLVPGIGAQGGDLKAVSSAGLTRKGGLLVNSSRAIIYADGTDRFAQVAGNMARDIQKEMEGYLSQARVI